MEKIALHGEEGETHARRILQQDLLYVRVGLTLDQQSEAGLPVSM